MKKLGKYGKKVSCVVIGMLCAAAIGACGSTQSGSQDEKDVRNDISVYEEGADLEGTLTYGTLFIEPQTQHMIDLFMKEHPGVKIETKVVFDNDVTDEQYNEGLNTLLTELASDQRADIYDATYLPSEIKTKGSGYFEDLNQYIDADPNFNRDDYYDNILRAAEVDGKLYQIPEGFYYVMLRLNRNITDELNYEVPDEMDINDLYELYQQAKPIADDDFTIDVQNNIYVFLPMTEDRAYLKKEEVNFDSENYVDFLRKMQELYQYQPSYVTYAFTDIKSFSGKSVLLNTFTNLLEGSPSGMFEETDTATKPILLKSTDGKIPFWRIGEDFSMSSGCKDKALAWEFIKFCIGQKQFEFEDANSDSYYRNFFTYGSMLNKENTRQLVAYQLENDDDTAEKWEAYNEKVSAKAFRDLQLDTATKPILLKSTDGKIPFWRIGEDFSMSSGCKDKALAWEFIKFCIGQKQFEFEDANSDSYYRNFFTYGSMLNKENTRQLVAYQLENDDDTAEKWEAYNEKVSAKAFRDLQLDSILTEIRNECMEQKITPEECAKLFQQRAELYVNE